MLRGACWCAALLSFSAPLHGSVIYAIESPLGPLELGEAASASVIVIQDTTSTLTLSFAYQFESRFALTGTLFAGGVLPVFTVAGLPLLSTPGFPSTAIIDNTLAAILTTQPVLIELSTTSGSLTGGGQLILSVRQGGGPPLPPDADVPEPGTFALLAAGCTALAGSYRRRAK